MGQIVLKIKQLIILFKSVKVQKIVCLTCIVLPLSFTQAQEDIDVGETGWQVKRPVMAAACDNGCPWGELGDFVKEAMKPYGYSVILCRKCNRWYGPRLVSENDYPPALDEINLQDGVNVRVNARVDFGVTSTAVRSKAYHTTLAGKWPYSNLRLIAKLKIHSIFWWQPFIRAYYVE